MQRIVDVVVLHLSLNLCLEVATISYCLGCNLLRSGSRGGANQPLSFSKHDGLQDLVLFTYLIEHLYKAYSEE